ncbi:MAG TPA: CaiB/BaiF CoA-transferase family protein [Acidimicrobiales bacterium]|nr:CaiB/BaiF CoA-transferase family protein [Acidimicrobiales bacterium]
MGLGGATAGGPLGGLRVLELAGIGPGPFAAMWLADMGADVLRLERGDPDAPAGEHWDLTARSRPSVALDLKNPAGRDLVLELSARADALIEGFRPGVAERLGVGPDEVRVRNPALVYARMTGYGQDGPWAQRAGHDINYIGLSGALWPLGRSGERPVPPLNLVGDFGGGAMYLVAGLLAAVLHARATGEGQVVDASMVDGSASLMTLTYALRHAGVWRDERGVNILDTGAPFYEVYETADGGLVAVGAIEAPFYRELVVGLGLDPDALPAQMDRTSWPALKRRFAELFATRTREEWLTHFADRDACVSPVLSPSEAAEHPHNVARGTFVGPPLQPAPAPRFSATPAHVGVAPQSPGAGTREGLSRWGVDEARLAALREAGAFG